MAAKQHVEVNDLSFLSFLAAEEVEKLSRNVSSDGHYLGSLGKAHCYRLHSFAVAAPEAGAEVSDNDFLIRSEDHGVPQKRHRVIILGIRDDIERRPQLIRKSQKSTVSEAIGNLSPLRS